MFTTALSKILFLDIETVSFLPDYQGLDDQWKELWQHKASYWAKESDRNAAEPDWSAIYQDRAAIYAEFGRVVCISMGFLTVENDQITSLRLKSIAGDDENLLLQDFAALLTNHFGDPEKYFLCGHNIKEFDIPYLARRMIIHGIPLPAMLDIPGKKPWETRYLLDTMEMWKFGDYKHYTSLKLLAKSLGIPSPKDDIDGSQVGRVYWKEKDLPRIQVYCEKDVVTVARVFLRLNGLQDIGEDKIVNRAAE